MNAKSSRRWLPVAVVCLLLAGIFTPLAILGQESTPVQQRTQLAALISAAESSRSYASSTIGYAAANGISVSSAQAQLSQGDNLLTTAQTDAQSGTNLAAGIQAVQAAMSLFAKAAATSSLALTDAGLTASVDYYAAVSAVAEVNATVNVAASVAAQACAGASVTTAGAQGVAQACAQVNADVASARAYLREAASLLVTTSGHVATSADVSQALTLVAQARGDVQATQSGLLTIASYTYSKRGASFVASVMVPLSASANATAKGEKSVVADLTAYQSNWTSYVQSQASASSSVNSSASSLATAVSQVNTGAVSTSVGAAQSTAAQVNSQMSALLNIKAIAALPGVVADIDASISATSAFTSNLGTAQAWSGTYSQTSLSSFGTYLSAGDSIAAEVQSSGSSYVSAYQKVVADLSSLLNIQGVQAIYNTLVGLQVAGTVSGANAALSSETGAMATVQADVSSLNSAVSSDGSAVLVGSTLLQSATSVSAEGMAYLNATGRAALAQVSSSAKATAQAAQSFVASAQALLQASIGTYSSAESSLGTSSASLSSQTRTSTSATATAVAYMNSDLVIRAGEAATGRADVTQALQFFSSQNVSAGVAAMAQATLEFQAASSVSAG